VADESSGVWVWVATGVILAFLAGNALGSIHNDLTALERCVTQRRTTVCESWKPKELPKLKLPGGGYLRLAP
jgi:hypothetical protein